MRASPVNTTSSFEKDPYPNKALTISSEAKINPKLAGIVSTDPAHLMNSDIEGVAIALKGRVPCKVDGPVKKGEILVTGPVPGTATGLRPDSATPSPWCVVGKSLEDSDDSGIRLIEVAV